MPHQVVPAGKLAALKRTGSDGKGSTKTKGVRVVLKAHELTPGGCHPDRSTDTFSLRLEMVDDDGDVILDETRDALTCSKKVGKQKFQATYSVENCEGSVAPDRKSKGDVTVTATTDDGDLVVTRRLLCKK